MNIKLATTAPAEAKVGLVILPVFEETLAKKGDSETFDGLDDALEGVIRAAAKQDGYSAGSTERLVLHTHGKIGASHLVLIGLGPRKNYSAESLRRACGRGAKEAARRNITKVAVAIPDGVDEVEAARAAAEGVILGAYRFDKWKTSDEIKKKKDITHATLLSPGYARNSAAKKALDLGISVGEAVNFARDLVNESPGVMGPQALIDAAAEMGKEAGLKVVIHEKKKIEQLKMGMFLGVAQGSAQPPRLIEIKYVPTGAKKNAAPLALVGKAVTFDSGGLSLKPADAMADMKTDMAGSAAVFAAMKVIAEEIRPDFPVTAYVGACENMPSGTSYRPGDILTARNGKTVEITNTDAEGRLVLGDVLTYATESKPRAIIDLATLTGACIVALGQSIVGTFGSDDELIQDVLEAAKEAGEDLWHMPLSNTVRDDLKSEVADIKNSGTRWGGAISAALFLKEFVGDTPWVHLDIAGPSTSSKDRGYIHKGGTGVGVRTLVELVRRMNG